MPGSSILSSQQLATARESNTYSVLLRNRWRIGTRPNGVSITCLQEIMAGWLNVVGSYRSAKMAPNTHAVAILLDLEASERVFAKLAERVEETIKPGLTKDALERISERSGAPDAFGNILTILVAGAARRHKWTDISDRVTSARTNPADRKMRDAWLTRVDY